MNQDDTVNQLETTVQGMQWGTVSLEPSQEEVQALDQHLPADWTELLEQHEFSPEEIQALMDAPLDVPEGDITENARQAIAELDIDVYEIMQEIDGPEFHEQEIEKQSDRHDDFGR